MRRCGGTQTHTWTCYGLATKCCRAEWSLTVQVLDESAFALCKENKIPVLVFDLSKPGNITRAVMGSNSFGTVVNGEPDLPDDMLPDVNQHFVAGSARD